MTFLEFAIHAANEAGDVALRYFQSDVTVERKADHSPVTIADREAEKRIRNLIAAQFPTHAVLGEEFGESERPSFYKWIIDPIDGTQSFIHGVPTWGVLIGLTIDDVPSLGVAHFPALNETLAAARGKGCTWNGQVARVSTTASLADAAVAYTDTRQLHTRLGQAWSRLQADSLLQRGWGDCYGHCLVATGRADVALDAHMKPWDCAALLPILQEAGGTFTDWQGRPTIYGGDAVSTNGVLVAEMLRRLAGAETDAGNLGD